MPLRFKFPYAVFLLLTLCQCRSEKTLPKLKFDSEKWKVEEGSEYPFRERMLDDVIFNDSLRSLNKMQLLVALGDPNRDENNHLYYTINQTLLGAWPLHKKTMVIKMSNQDQVEWIKIHE